MSRLNQAMESALNGFHSLSLQSEQPAGGVDEEGEEWSFRSSPSKEGTGQGGNGSLYGSAYGAAIGSAYGSAYKGRR